MAETKKIGGRGGGERYRYTYKLDELKEWMPRLKGFTARTGRIYLIFNNHPGSGAPLNSRQLK